MADAPGWKTASVEAAFQVVPELQSAQAADAGSLLVFLCFLADSPVPLELLSRGSTPRKRWSESGSIEETDMLHYDLSPVIVKICSSPTKLEDVLSQLRSISAITETSEHTFRLDRALVDMILTTVPIGFHLAWKLQACIMACHSIPWKYLESRLSNMDFFLPHIRYTLQEARSHDIYTKMSLALKDDQALCMVEASRFSGMEWKRFAINVSKDIICNEKNDYVRSCIAQREALFNRITGSMEKSAQILDNISHEIASDHLSIRFHSNVGHSITQRALNHIQVEELREAVDVLNSWHPNSPPSLMEVVVIFRKHCLLGKIRRYRGDFEGSVAEIMVSQNIVDNHPEIVFTEDMSDLVCSLADTYIEMGDPVAAEKALHKEISRTESSPGALLKLTLAETLFAQRRLDEAKSICDEVESFPKLLKMGRLRLFILQAKLAHIKADYNEALRCWTGALAAVSRFNLVNGHTTRILLLSMCEILLRQGNSEMELKSRDQVRVLERHAGPGGTFHWIAGLREWLKYLDSTTDRSYR